MSSNLEIHAWNARISGSVALILILRIIYNDYKNRKRRETDSNNPPLPSNMRFYYIATFIVISSTIIVWILRKINPICKYIYGFVGPSALWPVIFISFYQISRLQLCFASKNKAQFGYSKYIFIIEYGIGWIIFICSMCISFLKIEVYEIGPNNNWGCSFTTTKWTDIPIIAISLGYIIWDWSILGLYIYKILQFKTRTKRTLKRRRETSERQANGTPIGRISTQSISCSQIAKEEKNMNKIFKRIDIILKKIMLLTIFVEIGYVICTIMTLLGGVYKDTDHPWILNIEQVAYQLQLVNIGFALYLMLDHNETSYHRFLRILELFNICCCFKSLIENMNQEQIVVESVTGNDTTKGKTPTGKNADDIEDIAVTEDGVEIRLDRKGTVVSADTKTHNDVMHSPTIEYEDNSLSSSFKL